MDSLNIDIETYSSINLKTSGVYKYVEAEDFTILLLAVSENRGPVVLYDLTVEELPGSLVRKITDPAVLKKAYNANFERTCLAKYLGTPMPPEQWKCTMVHASMLGLPLDLDSASRVLHLTERKDTAGKALIRKFTAPCKPTKANGFRTRNLPEHFPQDWLQFGRYGQQDVRVEMAIEERISWHKIPVEEQELWCIDQHINDRGIELDPDMISNALAIDAINRKRLTAEAIELTALRNPNSRNQLLQWLNTEMPEENLKTLRKADVPLILKKTHIYTNEAVINRVLAIRQEMAKTSIRKYRKMLSYICADGRARGMLQHYGANRTGRWAGRGVQLQNLPGIKLGNEALDLARRCVLEGNLEELELLFPNVPNVLSQLIRTAFVAPRGKKFTVADFSAIEARVIAWLAGERWRLEVFRTHGKIYEASAAAMFRILLEEVTKELRQKGKVAELALGYQGGVNALIAMGILKDPAVQADLQKIKDAFLEEEYNDEEAWLAYEEEAIHEMLSPIVVAWRLASPAIVACWKEVNEAAISAVKNNTRTSACKGKLKFYMKKGILFMELPSGRCLSYLRAKLKPGKFGGHALTYEGLDQKTNSWRRLDTYGGKLVENAVQAMARDCLAVTLHKMYRAGYKIVMHVHDEVVTETPKRQNDLEDLCDLMAAPMPWAAGLPLTAAGFTNNYYKKEA